MSVLGVVLLLYTKPYVLFFFPLDATLLSFPLFFFYMLYLSDLGGGRYCTDKASSPSAISTHSLKDTDLSCLSL